MCFKQLDGTLHYNQNRDELHVNVLVLTSQNRFIFIRPQIYCVRIMLWVCRHH
jgi:hypothetical protein